MNAQLSFFGQLGEYYQPSQSYVNEYQLYRLFLIFIPRMRI